MSIIPDKKEYKNCTREIVDRFVDAISARKIANKVAFSSANERSHQEVHGFKAKDKKATIVFDTKAQMLTITAFGETFVSLDKLYGSLLTKKQEIKKQEPKKEQTKKTTKKAEKKPEPPKTEKKKEEEETTGGNISLKKFNKKRFDEVINKLKKDKNKYKLKKESHLDKDKATELITYIASNGSQKAKIRFMPKKQVLQLQGKQGTLFAELSLLLSAETDFKSALSAHIEQSKPDKKATEVERQLKKLIPSALPYLTDTPKLNFSIAVVEILNSEVEHLDYSMLFLPAFRGLEGLIFNIQQAQGIEVKMIGQAYEKEEGNYVLKASYRRKINSIVYAEVLASLYREYFATRNYYTHSENPSVSGSRVVSSRAEAREIFNHILKTVEYNCKKLTEINFSLKG